MTTNTPTRPLIIFSALMAALAVVALFVVAIGAGVGVMILMVLCVGVLGAISLVVFRGVTATGLAIADKRLDSQREKNRHVEAVLKMNYDPFEYHPIIRQIEAPAQAAPQLAPAKGIQFDSASMDANAINLLLYSCQLLGRNSKRIASNPECAAANIPGYNGRKWDAIINKHLKLSFDIATVPGPVENGGGAFVPESIGTVGALYDILLTRNNREIERGAVNALPEVKR